MISAFDLVVWAPSVWYARDLMRQLTGPLTMHLEASRVLTSEERAFFFEAIGKPVRTNLLLCASEEEKGASVLGSGLGNAPVVFFNPNLFSADKDALSFIFKHQIYHIDNGSCLKTGLTALTTAAVSGMALAYFESVLPAPFAFIPFFAAHAVSRVAEDVFQRRAADFTLNAATDQELRGFERFMRALDDVRREFCDADPHIEMNEAIQFVLGPVFKELRDCSLLLQGELRRRGLATQDSSGAQHEALKEFHRENIRKSLKTYTVINLA